MVSLCTFIAQSLVLSIGLAWKAALIQRELVYTFISL